MHVLPTRSSRRPLTAALLLLAAFVVRGPAATAGATPTEQWYVIEIADTPVGSVHEQAKDGDGVVQVDTRSHMVLNRLGSKVEMTMAGASRESATGRLIRLDFELKLSQQATSLTAVVEEGKVRLTSRAGMQSFERELPFSGEILGPDGLRRLSAERLRAPGDEVRAQVFSPELAVVTTVTRRVLAAEAAAGAPGGVGAIGGAIKVEERVEGYPFPRTLWLDAAGLLVQSEEQGPFGMVRMRRADQAAAERAAGGGELPAESYGSTVVRTQVRIPKPRRTEWLELRLTHRRPEIGWPDFDHPNQRVRERTADGVVLEIRRPPAPAGQIFPVAATAANREYLEPNAYVQSNDPELAAQARAIVGEERDLVRAGVALQRWVAESMTFDAGIVLAPSVEVFRDRRGTCAGYAMLLTAMARSVGIPARYVLGYVYVDGMFGGHAWTEVLAGETWVPLDSAIPAAGIADAARFAFLTTSLAAGAGSLGAGPAAAMYGQIDLVVLGYGREGEPRRQVAADAPLYTVEGDRYRNTGLGLALDKPARLRFTALEEVWPSPTLLALEGPAGERVVLERRQGFPWEDAAAAARKELGELVPEGRSAVLEVAGRPALLAEADGKAALAVPDGDDIWVLHAQAMDAAALLREVAAGLRL